MKHKLLTSRKVQGSEFRVECVDALRCPSISCMDVPSAPNSQLSTLNSQLVTLGVLAANL
jgi:hypothetical protein